MSHPTYTVIGHSRTRALRVLWALEELGLPYGHTPAAPRSDEARASHPSGRIPVLAVEEGGEATSIPDSVAILTHLADRHGGLGHPAGTTARARQDAATQFVVCEMDAPLWTLAKHAFALPEARRVPAIKETARWEVRRAERELEEWLGDAPFLSGDAPGVPDILAAHCVLWAVAAKVPEGPPTVRAWAASLADRAAYRRAAAMD